jgi:hypothetical protein
MDPQSLLPRQRAAYYLAQADRLLDMAEQESGKLRDQLLTLAEEYQELADRLGVIHRVGLR